MYDPSKIEPKWQEYWKENKTFKCKVDSSKEKYYVLDMFPYPSGAGLHVGHPEGYTATDIICRFERMRGKNVLHPMGWDAFGLPAENYAIKTGRHPREVTDENIATFKRQIQSIGFSYDWDREVDTTDPDYYKWTQWIFLQLYKKGLAYESELPINWCPSCKTGLANEEVVNGKCDRCGNETTKKLLRQWVLKITEYADRLLEDLESVDWPEPIKIMQRNWIGKSHGLLFTAPIKDTDLTLQTYSAHYEAMHADTFVVIAPDHPFLKELLEGVENKQEILDFCDEMIRKRDERGFEEEKESEGIFTGRYIVDPLGNGDLPIWVASFALADYGTGIVKCSAHDERDFAFAKKYGIKLKPVLFPEDEVEAEKVKNLEYCYFDMKNGILTEPERYAGQKSGGLREKMADYAEEMGFAERKVQYKLRDWIFSRQRYWGEPIPLIHCEKCGVVPVPEDQLPIELPKVENYQPTGTGESPLATIDEWVNTKCPQCGASAKRETNTMPQWGGSCWYYLRYISPNKSDRFVDAEEEKYWMNVDLYVGGAEHAVLHLLYARFWHKVLFDLGFVSHKEPFQQLMNQGLILGEDGEKMSKSRGNVINPDDVIKKYGADTLRLYEMFMGPFEAVKPWSTKSIEGCFRFAQKVYRIVEEGRLTDEAPAPELEKLLHKTIKKVTYDTGHFGFNTAISAMMVLANEVQKSKTVSRSLMKNFVLILSPYAPHLGEELWEMLGGKGTLAYEVWPEYDEKLTIDDTFELVFSVNGKVRGKKEVPKDISKEDAIAEAREDENVQRNIEGKEVIKEIYVPGKLVNIVIK